MSNRKKIVAAIVALLLGTTIYTFANPAGTDEEKNKKENKQEEVVTPTPSGQDEEPMGVVNNNQGQVQAQGPVQNVVVLNLEQLQLAVTNGNALFNNTKNYNDEVLTQLLNDLIALVNEGQTTLNNNEGKTQAEIDQLTKDINDAIDKVNDRIAELEKEAEDAVDKVRESLLDEDFKDAEELVNNLPDGDKKDELKEELDEIDTLIDRTAPEAEVSYSIINPTNKNVIATLVTGEAIVDPEGWTKHDNGTYTKEYTENVKETLTVEDISGNGNKTTINIEIGNIDKIAPTATVSYSITKLTNKDVEVTITPSEEVTAEGWTKNSDNTLTKTYANNDKSEVILTDLAGNTVKVNVLVDNIDKVAPTAIVSYSITKLTNKDVVVTITPSEEVTAEGWTKNSDNTLTKTYTANTDEDVIITDNVGNTSKVNIKIINIDKVAPTATVSYSTKELTNGNVVVTITPNEEVSVTGTGWIKNSDNTLTKTFTANTTKNITITDLAGNTAVVKVRIKNIDKVAPTATVSYSITELKNKDVVVTITPSEEVTAEGWTKNSDNTLTKTYSVNTTEDITITDKAGNKTVVNVEIKNIDKVAPTATVSYSITELTNKDVVVTITPSEEATAEGWTKNSDNTLTKTYTANTNEDVTITDKVGNASKANVKIENIDKVVPTAIVSYSNTELTNKDVVVTITPSEEVTAEGWTKNSDNTLTKTYVANTNEDVTITDKAGNTAKVNVKIGNIDKTAPVVTLNKPAVDKFTRIFESYKQPKNSDVNVNDENYNSTSIVIEFVKPYEKTLNTINKIKDDKVGTYKITYTVTDKAGNKTVVTRLVHSVQLFDSKNDLILDLNNTSDKNNTYNVLKDSYVEHGVSRAKDVINNKIFNLSNINNNEYISVDTSSLPIGSDGKLNKVGKYDVVYTLTDWSGNRIHETRTVYVVDREAPTYTLSTTAKTQLNYAGMNFEVPTIESVSDNYYSTDDIKIERMITVKYDYRKNGSIFDRKYYKDTIILNFKYVITDGSGNKAETPVLNINISKTEKIGLDDYLENFDSTKSINL